MIGLKALSAILLAALAVSAVVASSASAKAFDFKAEEEDVSFVGFMEGEDMFAFDAGTVGCSEGFYGGAFGTAKVTNTTAIVIPILYSGCTFLGLEAPVDFNGCFFVFHTGTFEENNFEGSMSIGCIEPTKRIEFTAFGCTITVPPQANVKTVTYTNIGEEEDEIEIHIAADNLKYEEHKKGAIPTCASNTVAKSNGAVDARVALSAEKNEVSVPIWVAKT